MISSDEIVEIDGFDRVPIPGHEQAVGKFLYLPTGWWGVAPIWWRWSASELGMVEIRSFKIIAGSIIQSKEAVIVGWLHNDDEFADYLNGSSEGPPTIRLNALGWSWSFGRAVKIITGWEKFTDGIDIPLAIQCFEKAADQGCWESKNNLGVIYRDGIGRETNLSTAFQYFREAAESLHHIPIKHLSDCYRKGLGCAQDDSMADYLLELAEVCRDEGSEA